MLNVFRDNASASYSREQLLVELIDWCHSLTVLETEGDAAVFQATGREAEQFARSLGEKQQNVREFLASIQRRLQEAGDCLENRIQVLEQELEAEREQTGRLGDARDAMMASLTVAESRLAETQERLTDLEKRPVDTTSPSATNDDFERRYQMALEDIRQEKEKNTELQEQIAQLRITARKSPRQHNWLDWETEKQRIVAALEADSADNDETKRTERLGIEEVLRMTDEVIASKDREIRELKRQLADRAEALAAGPQAPPAPPGEPAPTANILDSDAAVQEERARLQSLQKEWRDKLRQAEIDISVERAKIARERADLDEQVRLIKDTLTESRSAGQPEQSSRGRWLAQLGLTPADREPSRRRPNP